MHLFLLTASPKTLLPLAMYFGWLIVGGTVVGTFWVRRQQTSVGQDRRLLLRRKVSSRPTVEGLGWFALAATVGLVIHLVNALKSASKSAQQENMWLVLFILATGCLVQLRGPAGDPDAPIPDRSPTARVARLVRRLAGVMIGSIGVWLLYLGGTGSSTYSDAYSQAILWFFKASGALLVLIGLALALRSNRNDA